MERCVLALHGGLLKMRLVIAALLLVACATPRVAVREVDVLPESRTPPTAEAPAWCQGPRSTWNGWGCSTR